MTVAFLDLANTEIEATFNYYSEINPELGSAFAAQFRHGIESVLEHPNAWAWIDKPYRRYRLQGFPYQVIYRLDERNQKIIVIGVVHFSRKPGIWRGREKN